MQQLLQPCQWFIVFQIYKYVRLDAWLLGEDLLLFKVLYKSVCEPHYIIIQGQVCNRIVYITAIIIYKIMKKLLDSDWLRAVQFKWNTKLCKKCNWHQCKLHTVILDYDWLIDNRNFLSQWYHVKWWQKSCRSKLWKKVSWMREKWLQERSFSTSSTEILSCYIINK